MELDFIFMKEQIPLFVKASILTLQIALLGIAGSVLLGIVNSIILYYKIKILNKVVAVYVEVSRNTPLLIQIFFLYFGLPALGIKLSNYTCALTGIIFLGGSYMTEAFRAGLESIEKIQIESGLSIGLSKKQLMRYVIFPQAFRIALPATGANFIFLLKETSVVSAISVAELLYTTNSLIAIYYKTYEMLFLLVISYFILIGPLSFILYITERRMKYD